MAVIQHICFNICGTKTKSLSRGGTDSQNCRITEWWGLEGTSVGHPAQPPAQAGSPRTGCTGPRPGGAGISPEKETPQPPWAACSGLQH